MWSTGRQRSERARHGDQHGQRHHFCWGPPLGIAIAPDGTRAYVANLLSNDVSVIDTATNTVIDTVPVGTLRRP